MLNLNPEFRRYLWMELSLHKLVAIPVVLAGAFLLADTTHFGVADAAKIGFMLLVYLWGTRQAAAAVAEEVRGGTWDSQRMSALDAWPMAWGKLFGATAVSWYGGLICLGVYAADTVNAAGVAQVAKAVIVFVLNGLIAQAVALSLSLAIFRKHDGERTIPVSLCQLAAFGTLGILMNFHDGFWIYIRGLQHAERLTWWNGASYDDTSFFVVSAALMYGWAVLAVHRLMRAELQHRTLPWGWAAFLLYLMVFAGGFADDQASGITPERLGKAFVIAVASVYSVFLLENKNVIAVKAWIEAVRTRRWFALALATPSWLVCLAIALAVGAVYAAWAATMYPSSPIGYYLSGSAFRGWGTAVAMLFFLLRDIGFLMFMNLCTRFRRPDIAGAIYLAVLYGVAGGILGEANLDIALAFVLPNDTGNLFLTIAPPLLEAATVWVILVYRLRGTLRVATPTA